MNGSAKCLSGAIPRADQINNLAQNGKALSTLGVNSRRPLADCHDCRDCQKPPELISFPSNLFEQQVFNFQSLAIINYGNCLGGSIGCPKWRRICMRIGRKGFLTILLLASVALWGADSNVGTWKLNAAKSKYTTDHPAPQSLTVTFKEQPDGLVLDAVGVDAKGEPIKIHWAAKFDGKDYPSTGAAGGADTVSLKRLDANTIETANKNNGQVVTTVRSVVSADGKTRTSTWSGKDSKGKSETWTVVFDKQ
jgi:hypothetical protein